MAIPSKIPVAIVGGGRIAPYHAKYILSSPTCQLIAVIDPFPSGQELAENLSVLHFKTVADLVASGAPQPELYYICTPSGLHVKLAREVLERASAKVIMVEKPLSTDSASGEELLALAESKGCVIATGHHRRFHPAAMSAKATIVSGRLGKLTAISGLWTTKKNDGYFDIKWRTSRAQGGGVVWTNFVHDVDLLQYMAGSNVVRVWATGAISRRGYESTKENDAAEEGAAIMLQFANGVIGTFVLSDNVSSPYTWESATGENPLITKAEPVVDCFRFFGTDGTLSVPDGNLWTYKQEDADVTGQELGWTVPMTREVLVAEEGIPFQTQIEHLGRVVKGQEKPICSGRDGLEVVKVCEAVVKAIDSGDGLPVDIK